MPNKSNKTKPVAFRIPIDTFEVLERRVKGKRSKWATVNKYLRDRVVYDTDRKHGRDRRARRANEQLGA